VPTLLVFGARNLGRVLCRELAADGWRVAAVARSEETILKLRELESIGVDQFNIYLMTHGRQETLDAYGGEIIPQFTGVPS